MSNIKIGLDAIGLQDSHHLKCALVNCEDPLKAISDFQEENSILLPTLKPALPLLDLHNVKRLEFHQSVADELKEKLAKRIEALADSKTQDDINKLEELLDKSFPVLNIPRITNLVLLIMKHMPKINSNYLNYIKDNVSYYQIAPIEVKRQIWLQNEELFYVELNPIFEKCLQHFDEQLLNFEITQKSNINKTDNASDKLVDQSQINSLKFKRHSVHVNDIVKMIGNNGKLYFNAVNYLLKLFINTKNWNYASIRSLLLMKLHDVDVIDLASSENIYKFTWTLNACLKERRIDTKRAKELEAIVDSKKFDKILPDISFILADCFALDTLAYTTIKLLFTKCVQNEILPRNCTELLFIIRLLSLGLSSWDIISGGQIKKDFKLDTNIVSSFLSNIANLMADYQERLYDESLNLVNSESLNLSNFENIVNSSSTPEIFLGSGSKMNSDVCLKVKNREPNISEEKMDILESIKISINQNDLCCVLTLYFTLECIELNDWNNLRIVLPIIKYPNNSNNFEKWYLSQLVTSLCEHIEYFKIDWIFKFIFNDFLLKHLKSDFSYELIFKLMEKLYVHLTHEKYNQLLEEIKPKKTPKVKRLNKIIHPNSRAAIKINREEYRKARAKKSKNVTKLKNNLLIQKLSWFQSAIEAKNEPISVMDMHNLVDGYFQRFNDELEQIRKKATIGKRTIGQHFNREQAILITLEKEKDEYETTGLEIPDLSTAANLKLFKEWKRNWNDLPNIKLIKLKSLNSK